MRQSPSKLSTFTSNYELLDYLTKRNIDLECEIIKLWGQEVHTLFGREWEPLKEIYI